MAFSYGFTLLELHINIVVSITLSEPNFLFFFSVNVGMLAILAIYYDRRMVVCFAQTESFACSMSSVQVHENINANPLSTKIWRRQEIFSLYECHFR